MRGTVTLAGLALIGASACTPPELIPPKQATACNATAGYAGPERCGRWIGLKNGIVNDPGPYWLWSFDAGHGGATPFEAVAP